MDRRTRIRTSSPATFMRPPFTRERRKCSRRFFPSLIRFTVCSRETPKIRDGLIGDMSSCGLWFFTCSFLRKSEVLEVRNDIPVPHRKGVVRWVKRLERNLYKAGIEFTQEQP